MYRSLVQSPEGGRGGVPGSSGEDFVFNLSHEANEWRDQCIIGKMMEEMMTTSEKAFGRASSPHPSAHETDSPSPCITPQSLMVEVVRPFSAHPYERKSPEWVRRPKSAEPALNHASTSQHRPGSSASMRGAKMESSWSREHVRHVRHSSVSPSVHMGTRLENSLDETARPFLKMRSSIAAPQRLQDNWIELDPRSFPTQSSPMFSKKDFQNSSNPSSPSRGNRLGLGGGAKSPQSVGLGVKTYGLEGWAARTQGAGVRQPPNMGYNYLGVDRDSLADMAHEMILKEDSQMSAKSQSSSVATTVRAQQSKSGGMLRPASASPSSLLRGGEGRRDKWQVEQAMRRKKQAERARQLAQACEVKNCRDATWFHRHSRLMNENKNIRDNQKRVHTRERKPFYICDQGHLQGRILYERLQVSEEVEQERTIMRDKISKFSKQRQRDLATYLASVGLSRAAPDYDAERKEFEKLVREAVESREAFDQFVLHRESAKDQVQRKQEHEKRQEMRQIVLEETALEDVQQREALHLDRLRSNFGMTLIEQVGAVENMRSFGVRIVRPDQPTTVLVGERRFKVKVPRLFKTSRGDSFPKIADTLVKKNFIIQIIPAEGYSKFLESADNFAGAYRLRIRYPDIRQAVRTKSLDGEDVDDDDDDTPKFTGPMRLNPIMLRITGSDGYLGVWREQPVSREEAAFENNLYYRYRGILETDRVPDAEYGTSDSIQLSGVDASERAVEVSEEFDFEFVERVCQ